MFAGSALVSGISKKVQAGSSENMAESDSPARGLSIAASRAITEALGWHPKQRRRTFWEHRVFFVPGRVLLGKQSKKMSLLVSAESVLGWLGPR